MKKTFLIFMALALVLFVFITQIKLSSHPAYDNDEGIYMTSFLLMDRRHEPYKETFFSQPPGFILSIFPGFFLFGKTLEASRLTVGFWSIVSLITLGWIGLELGSLTIGVLAGAILYLIPAYYNQTLALQSDAVVSAFSLICLASLIRYFKSTKKAWFVISVFFFNFAFWTKFEITLIPVILLSGFYFIKKSKGDLKFLTVTLILVSFLFTLFFIVPFDLKEVYQDSILYRFESLDRTGPFFMLIDFLKKVPLLFSILIGNVILGIVNKRKIKLPAKLIIVWLASSFVFFFFYRPLFPHHLAILSVPAALSFSYLFYLLFKNKKNKVSIFFVLVSMILAISVFNRLVLVLKTPKGVLNREQQKAVKIILKNTSPTDFVVSDEEILMAVSGRLPPPELSDISFVRIRSNNLSSDEFKQIVNRYKPKMIVSWNGRLRTIKNFDEVIKEYKKIVSFQSLKDIYLLK